MFPTRNYSGEPPASASTSRRQFLTGLAKFFAAPIAFQSYHTAAAGLGDRSTLSEFDGGAGAPAGSPQYPTFFSGLNGISPYPVRPPWRVAGVDYRVGIHDGVALKDPGTILPSVARRSGNNPIVLEIMSDNTTLNGYDFTLNGGWQIRSNDHSNLKISNSRLQNFCIYMDKGPLTVEFCEIDGLGEAGETKFGCLAFLRDGVTSTWKYNWLRRAQNDFIDLTTADIDARFNLFDTMGYAVGAHADAIQFAGDGTADNIKILFNTYVHTAATSSGLSSFIDLETQIGAGNQTMNNPEIAYNTVSNTAPGGRPGATFFRVAQVVGTISNCYLHDNYADPHNMIAVISGRPQTGKGYRKSGNILLTNGATF
jgi:hypothetical protein